MINKIRKINPLLFKVGLISFFTDISSEFLYPVTPIFLATVLGANATAIGLIEGSAEATASLLKVFSGHWSDRLQKRKVFIYIGYLFSTLSKPITGLASAYPLVLLARVLDRTGKGIRTAPRDALIAETVPESDVGTAFGIHRTMDTLGAVLGPLLAILFLTWVSDLRLMYFLAVIPGIASVALSFTLPETKTTSKVSPAKLKLNKLPKEFYFYAAVWSIFSVANSSDAFLILKAKQEGLSTVHSVLLYSFFNLIYAGASFPFGSLSDRIGSKKILVLGLLLFSLTYLGFAHSKVTWHFWALFLMYGTFMAMTEGVGKAFTISLVPSELKATALGFLGAVTGIATLFASLIAGLLWDHMNPSAPFLFGAAGALISAMLLLFVKPSTQQ